MKIIYIALFFLALFLFSQNSEYEDLKAQEQWDRENYQAFIQNK